jgi:signal transduction histidine kinase
MRKIRQHLGWKLFFSYLVIILVGVISLAIAGELQAPISLERHMVDMDGGMSGMMGSNIDGMLGDDLDGMTVDLTDNFQQAINEVLLVAASIAFITAVIISSFVTRRIVSPVRAMKEASQRIAGGRYEERVQVSGEDELAELAQSFNQMAHQLEQTENRRSQLIGDVAHELRTPLSSVKSVLEGIQDGVLPADGATFANMQSELSRLQRLVRDLEQLSKAEAGQIPLELSLMNPVDLVKTAVNRLSLQYEEKGIALHTKVAANLPLIHVDAERMTQVMINLLGNALQYTPANGEVTINVWVEDNQLSIAVQDTGIGIAPENLHHIFERFYRVDKSRARIGGGSGIGLTISKHLVEMFNGRLTVTTPGLNQGSTFIITLPLTNAS